MSTKFEQLLDYLVNEEMDKANELFHEIVVEKSRSIYENLIAEEEDEENQEEVDEAEEDQDESVEENVDLEDSYMMDGGDEEDGSMMGGDQTDDLERDTEMGMDDEGGSPEDEARDEIEAAIAELTAALEKLGGSSDDSEMDAEFGSDDEMDSEFSSDDDEEDDEDEGMMYEGRRMTREYTETVGVNWDKNSQKTQGQIVGANTGEKMPNATENNSPISKGTGKPTTGATAANILGSKADGAGTNTGTTPGKVSTGIAKTSGDKFAKGMHNVDGAKSGVRTLSKQPGHGPEKKGGGEGQPAGAGTGEKASGAVNAKSIVDKKIG